MEIEPKQQDVNHRDEFIDLDGSYNEQNNFAQAYRQYHQQGEYHDDLDDIGIDLRFNEMDEDKIAENIQFFINELGGVKRLQGHDIYIITETAEKSLKDLKKKLKNENPSFPFVKYLLGKWDVLKINLLPIIHTQKENKTIIYEVLIILVFLTEPISLEQLEDFKYKDQVIKQYESYKSIFSEKEFIQNLLDELAYCVQKKPEERNQFENDIIELILYLIRNSLAYKSFKNNQENQSILIKIFELYAKENGFFSAIVYLSNDFNDNTKGLCYLLMEIVYLITSKIKIGQIFGNLENNENFKRQRLIQKLKENQRQRATYSTRHSNFGAIFQIKKDNKTIGIVSDPKQIKQINSMYTNKHIKNKIQKPKTRSKIPYKNTDFQSDKQQIQFPVSLKNNIQLFIIDLLEHSFTQLVEINYKEFYSEEKSKIRIDENKIFVDFLTFGLKVALIKLKRQEKTNWFLTALQLNFIDFVYNKLQDALENEKSQQNYHFIFSSLDYLVAVLKSIKYLHCQKDPGCQQNKKILEAMIFSKDFSKTIKKLLQLFKKVPKNLANQNLIRIIDLYFQMLSNYSLNKVFTIQQHYKDDQIPEWEDVTEMENFRQNVKLKEKRFTYLTELGLFLDFEIVQVHLEYLKDESFALRSQDLKEAVFSFMRRIIEDLHASWVFYQIDFLEILYKFTSSKDPIIKIDQVSKEIKKLALDIFSEVRKYSKKNQLLIVEMLFRFQNFNVKENILSNYSGIRSNLRVEEINLEISLDQGENENITKPRKNSFIVDDNYIEKEEPQDTIQKLKSAQKVKDIVDDAKIDDYQNLIFKEEKNEKRKIKITRRLIKKRLACKEKVADLNQKLQQKNSSNKKAKFIKKIEDDDEILINKNDYSDDSLSLEIIDDEPLTKNDNLVQNQPLFDNIQKSENDQNINNKEEIIKDEKIVESRNNSIFNPRTMDQYYQQQQNEDEDDEEDFMIKRKSTNKTKI